MRELLIQAREEYANPCMGCPFIGNHDVFSCECMHCYELFPGFGDMYLTECFRTTKCPCDVFGREFVTKVVQLYLEGDWV